MNTKLITALRLTATAIDNQTFAYDWLKQSRCNCGALFCALSGRSADELWKTIGQRALCTGKQGYSATWTDMVGCYCPITGMTTDTLFKELLGYGLTPQDIVNLEYLKDRAVLAKVGRQLAYNNSRDAAQYMRAWADLLVERERDNTGEPAVSPPVAVEQSVTPVAASTAPAQLTILDRIRAHAAHLLP